MLKQILTATLLLGATLPCAKAQRPVQIEGRLDKDKKTPVKLFRVLEGEMVETATSVPARNGAFGFLFYPEYEGFYVVGTGNELGPNDNYKFYFKPGDRLSVIINDSSYTLTGRQNTNENILLTRWHDFVNPLEQKAVNFMRKESIYTDFFPDLERIASQSKNFMKGKRSGNPRFDRIMPENIAFDLAGYAANFLNTPRAAQPAVADYSPFYATLRAGDFAKSTAGIYRQPWGNRVLEQLVSVNMRQQNIPFRPGTAGLADRLAFIPNDTLRGDFVLQTAARFKSITDYTAMTDQYGQYLLTDRQQQRNKQLQAAVATLKAGDPAFNFSYPDMNGKMVSMKDLRGKVVLIDVWATWCGPCKQEIPHLKRLEETMKGTGVQVVSISVDEEKDREKWLKMVRDERLGGIQLFASGWSEITKYYKITGIPRFMVVDRKGRIVTVDAPRPSSPELRKLLEKTLAEG